MPMKAARAIITKWYCFCNIFPGPTRSSRLKKSKRENTNISSYSFVPYDILQQMKKNKVVNERLLTLSGYGAGFNTVAGTKNLIALNFNTLKARVL